MLGKKLARSIDAKTISAHACTDHTHNRRAGASKKNQNKTTKVFFNKSKTNKKSKRVKRVPLSHELEQVFQKECIQVAQMNEDDDNKNREAPTPTYKHVQINKQQTKTRELLIKLKKNVPLSHELGGIHNKCFKKNALRSPR